MNTSIVLFNSIFDHNTELGNSLSGVSTSLVAFFVVSNLILYNFRSIRYNSSDRKILVSRWNALLSGLYCIALVMQEIFMVYGQLLDLPLRIYGDISMLTIISWIICNGMCCIALSIAWVSLQNYRIMLYTIYPIQMASCGVVISERILLHSSALDFVIPIILITISTWIVYSVPHIYQLDCNRLKHERTISLDNNYDGDHYFLVRDQEESGTDFEMINKDNVEESLIVKAPNTGDQKQD